MSHASLVEPKALSEFASYLIVLSTLLLVLLLLGSFSLAYYFQETDYLPNDVLGLVVLRWLVVAVCMVASLLVMIPVWYGFAGFRTVALSLASTLLLCSLIVFFIEKLLVVDVPQASVFISPENRYTPLQENLQRLIQRRSQTLSREFRDEHHTVGYNDLGWPDQSRSSRNASRRIVFIGDSFLEVRSSKNLAIRVQDLLNATGLPVEIVNLSQAATSPIDYRYRLTELVSDYQPEHIVIFLYAGNDFSRVYQHRDYVPMTFKVTGPALLELRESGYYSSVLLGTLATFKARGQLFASKADFEEALDLSTMSLERKLFLYTVVFAYSHTDAKEYLLERIAPKTLIVLTKVWKKLFVPKPEWLSPKQQAAVDAQRTKIKFDQIFLQPKDERLPLIAKMAAEKMGVEYSKKILTKIKATGRDWTNEVIANKDVSYFVWPAINKLILNEPIFTTASANEIRGVTEQYLMLFKEYRQIAQRLNIEMSFVVIPEASEIDKEFQKFWRPLISFRQRNAFPHAVRKDLATQLPEIAPTLDLADFEKHFTDAYWRLDGHWNEKGNSVAAGLVSQYLLSLMSTDESVPSEDQYDLGHRTEP